MPDLCNAVLDLLIDGEHGIWHLTNRETLTWSAFASRLAERLGYKPCAIVGADHNMPDSRHARLPKFSGLISERGDLLPSLQSAIDRFVAEKLLQ